MGKRSKQTTKDRWIRAFSEATERDDAEVMPSMSHSLEELVDDWFGDDDADGIAKVALPMLLLAAAPSLDGALEAYSDCESPIEKMMFWALAVVLQSNQGEIRLGSSEVTKLGNCICYCHIETQVQIGKYRADFVVRNIGKFDGEEFKIVVECDGHDFHEKTREQAKRDKARDRFMQSEGYQVFRYTGSEIWADVFACAEEVWMAFVNATYRRRRHTRE